MLPKALDSFFQRITTGAVLGKKRFIIRNYPYHVRKSHERDFIINSVVENSKYIHYNMSQDLNLKKIAVL